MVPEAGRAEEAQRAAGLNKVPLDGFMGEADWNGVCLEMRTRGSVFWPIPVTLSPSRTWDTTLGLIVEYVGIVPAQPIYLLPSLGFQVRLIKGRGPAPCLFFKTSDR